jgi:hypothetical protein
MEKQLFSWTDWDGDLACMTYYSVVLKVDIGKYKQGSCFDVASISFEKGELKFYTYNETSDKFESVGEYDLELKVKGT